MILLVIKDEIQCSELTRIFRFIDSLLLNCACYGGHKLNAHTEISQYVYHNKVETKVRNVIFSMVYLPTGDLFTYLTNNRE